MAVPEGGPQTPENSARNEAILRAPGRRQNLQAETLRTLVVEFSPLDDGKRILYQMVAKLINGLNTAIIQQTNTIDTARPETADNNGNNKDNFTRFLPTDTANKHIRMALSTTKPIKDVQLNTPEAAESIISNGLLVGQRYIGSVEPYKVELKRCYCCQKFGHLAWLCKEQLNIWKSRAGMEALINNHQSQNLDLLLIQEPSITTYRTYVNHSAWRLYRPTYLNTNESIRFRSLLYVNKRISTSSHRQIHCNHPDLVAIKVWTAEIQFLIFLVYIPSLDIYQATSTTSAKSALKEIKNTIE
ncbi:hypothetical protein TSTA_110150 [Talaromyces stipitatus ATCC 10500]|uniref:CCHC-type domain-containing protein n=1 Tax=Talaromyces stipitatus (strain ATCC 10500 / CBS 375.48 / QM 6759 / NRRL 1006) TaxID=441959 RepID=B8MUG3_TALSN|nr:uncharacterized protein TSTA_110150 [Talaromyces stipitatus ATCC 10500]EED11835.1 hypothetical protein TSTA_110150 [Talaromyces stipitatus ATCC 10500]